MTQAGETNPRKEWAEHPVNREEGAGARPKRGDGSEGKKDKPREDPPEATQHGTSPPRGDDGEQ